VKLTAVILAAGYSSRMGGFKPLMDLAGRSLLARCAGLFGGAGIGKIVVVTGHRHTEVETEAARFGLATIHNPDYDRGMFTSVCTALPHLADRDGFFILPVDIPLVRPATITALAAAFTGETVVYPTFNGLRGHPPLIPAQLVPTILAHDGHGGLKSLLEQQEHQDVAVWDRGILVDADTPDDFAALAKRFDRLAIGDTAEALALAAAFLAARGMAHGLAVAQVAMRLGRELNRHGCSLDLELLHNGGLLHDIAKGRPQHEARGAELLAGLGFRKLAEVVAAHRDVPPPSSGQLSEKEVVCLADKLVRGTVRLPVERRFGEKLELYALDRTASAAIRARLANALALQALVEQATGRSVADILDTEPAP
jgi:molybdenum cofactor cytidylyltransferase